MPKKQREYWERVKKCGERGGQWQIPRDRVGQRPFKNYITTVLNCFYAIIKILKFAVHMKNRGEQFFSNLKKRRSLSKFGSAQSEENPPTIVRSTIISPWAFVEILKKNKISPQRIRSMSKEKPQLSTAPRL